MSKHAKNDPYRSVSAKCLYMAHDEFLLTGSRALLPTTPTYMAASNFPELPYNTYATQSPSLVGFIGGKFIQKNSHRKESKTITFSADQTSFDNEKSTSTDQPTLHSIHTF
jgi:hypothetical protein